VASQPNLPLPFRRYQFGNVWRVDKPGPGRFREFMQFDLDIVGTNNMLADAEIIAAMVSIMENLGVERFDVRYSNRKIANGVIESCGIPVKKGPEVLRVIDKLGRIGIGGVVAELGEGRVDESGAEIPGLSLQKEQIEKLDVVLNTAAGMRPDQRLDWARSHLKNSVIGTEGVQELSQVQDYLDALRVDSTEKTRFDITIVRGLGYYTGPVFETTLLDIPGFGSVFSGGRYDNLVDRFQSESVPAVGASIGIDRLLAALIELDAIKLTRSTSQVLVTVMDRERLPDYLAILNELREAGIPSEIYSGDTKNLTRQIRYADKVGIPLAVIRGSREAEAGRVRVKDLAAGAEKAAQTADRDDWLKADEFQEDIDRAQLVPYVKRLLISSNLRPA